MPARCSSSLPFPLQYLLAGRAPRAGRAPARVRAGPRKSPEDEIALVAARGGDCLAERRARQARLEFLSAGHIAPRSPAACLYPIRPALRDLGSIAQCR